MEEAASRPSPAAMTEHRVTFSAASPPALHDSSSGHFFAFSSSSFPAFLDKKGPVWFSGMVTHNK